MAEFEKALDRVIEHVTRRHRTLDELPTVPTSADVARTISSLPAHLPENGLGTAGTTDYLVNSLLPGILQGQPGPRYYGFVTGGVTEAAQLADILGGSYDENVQVTLPGITASTAVEARALEMVLDLLDIERDSFEGRTLTTGATASNVLGLACARDHVYANSPHLPQGYSYAQSGPPTSPTLPSPPTVLFTVHPHYSILKAASLVGLGSGPAVIQTIPSNGDDEIAFDIPALRARLKGEKQVGRGVVVVYGLGEVNTGGFGGDLVAVAEACEEFGAWLHVDAAFGGFARLLPELRHLTSGLEKANSITLDGHKWLNVPYDCGLFFTRSLTSLTTIFAPPAASTPAYLTAASAPTSQAATPGDFDHASVPSPLHVNIENSRRFRALPLFASLLSLGKEGYTDIIRRNIDFARRVASYLQSSPHYTLLNPSPPSVEAVVPMNIVLFCGSASSQFPMDEPGASARLVSAINGTRKIYVTGTKWRGVGAIRLAVSNWRTGSGGDGEWQVVKGVFEEVMR